MNAEPPNASPTSRRQFLRTSGAALLGGTLASQFTISGAAAAESGAGAANGRREPVDYVDPMIGSGNYSRWMQFPGATRPFGMVKLSPDNQEETYYGGYEYDISNIMGFSHIHSYSMSGLLMMPTTGPLQVNPGPQTDPDKGYRSRFRHQTEVASPGYYAVTLDDYGIRAEMTVTTRTGFHRYTFPKADESHILFDLMFPSEDGKFICDSRIRKVSNTEIEGYTLFVPHDVQGLIELVGGRDKFNARLVEGFERARPNRFASQYIDLTNQPNMQAAYLFNYSGAPWLTQKYVRAIMEESYGTKPNKQWGSAPQAAPPSMSKPTPQTP